nr:MAG TPA: hypothetical protein [Caudoviricetes sp.]
MTGSKWLVTRTFRLAFSLHCHFERSEKSVSSAEKRGVGQPSIGNLTFPPCA